jgi:transcription termination factor Rho
MAAATTTAMVWWRKTTALLPGLTATATGTEARKVSTAQATAASLGWREIAETPMRRGTYAMRDGVIETMQDTHTFLRMNGDRLQRVAPPLT